MNKEDFHMNHVKALCACAALLGAMAAHAADAPVPQMTPVEMRGLWFPNTEVGAKLCADYLGAKPVEPQPGALVINERQIQQWVPGAQHTTYFVTDVQPRRLNTWRLQALMDESPFEQLKVLETYVMEVREKELHWSKRRKDDPMEQQVDTTVFVRCGY